MKKTIPVIGMACSVCSANVEKKLQSLEGINSASVSLASRTALVDYNPDIISLEDMKREISNAGYDLVIENDRSVEPPRVHSPAPPNPGFLALRHPDHVFLHGLDFPGHGTEYDFRWRCFGSSLEFLRQPDLSAPGTRQPTLLRQTVLCFRLEATFASYGKHGFARSTQHPHRLPIQHLQHLLRRNGMGSERHRMAHLF